MSKFWRNNVPFKQAVRNLAGIVVSLLFASPAFAQGGGKSPWENAVNVLMTAFTSTIARGLSLVAIVVAGLLSLLVKVARNAYSRAFCSASAWPSPP